MPTYRSVGVGYHFEVSYGLLGRSRAKKLIASHQRWLASGKKGPIRLPNSRLGSRLKVQESKVHESHGGGLPTEKYVYRDRLFGRFGVKATYGVRPIGATPGFQGLRYHRRRRMGRDDITHYKGGTYYSVSTGQKVGKPISVPAKQTHASKSGTVKVTTTSDPAAIAKAVEQRSKMALLRIGYLIRQAAQASLAQRRGISSAGYPPSSHTGTLRNLILYAWDNATRTVVIGPVRTNGASNGRAPRALEYGGMSSMLRVVDGKRKRVPIFVQPRPFMRPAMHSVLPQFPGFFGT